VIGGGILKFEYGKYDAAMVVRDGRNGYLGKGTDESQNPEATAKLFHSSMRRDMKAMRWTVVV
jgi:hypothetical protein